MTANEREKNDQFPFWPPFAVNLSRSFKDGEEWKQTSADCLPAARVLERTFDDIDELAAQSGSSFVETAKETFSATATDGDDIPF